MAVKNNTDNEFYRLLEKARKYCALQERCHQEVREKLYTWGLPEKSVEQIISELISEGFVSEERFAKAYARGKFRIKRWGKNKIILELKKRNISEYSIRKGLKEIDEKEYNEVLKNLVVKKSKEVKDKNQYTRNHKIATYIAGKGFESELIWNLLKND
jgi:regulatory protein